jgi:hypothetical protein
VTFLEWTLKRNYEEVGLELETYWERIDYKQWKFTSLPLISVGQKIYGV